jgi:hypothetical protein
MGGCDLMTALRNGQPVTDAQLLGRIHVIGFGKRGHRYTSAAGDAHERLTRLHHMDVSSRSGLRRRMSARFSAKSTRSAG